MVSIHTNRLPTIMQRTCVQEQQWPTHPRDSPNVEIETTHDENADAVTYKTLIRVTYRIQKRNYGAVLAIRSPPWFT